MSTMRFKFPSISSSLAFPSFSGENRKLKEAETLEMEVLGSYVELARSMKTSINISLAERTGNDELNLIQVSSQIHRLIDDLLSSFSLNNLISRIDKEILPGEIELLKSSVVGFDPSQLERTKTALRLQLLRRTLNLIQKLVDENEVKLSSITRVALSKVIDSVLFGSASERIAG